MVGGLYYNIIPPLQFFEKNIKMNSNILSISHQLGVKNLLVLSTCIFPDNIGRSIKQIYPTVLLMTQILDMPI